MPAGYVESGNVTLLRRKNLAPGREKAGGGNRTLVTSLEGWSFTTKLHPQFTVSDHYCPVISRIIIIGYVNGSLKSC